MRTYTTTHTVYSFDELSESSKEKAISNLRDTNVDHDWWEWTYSDAEAIGLDITSFDLDRNRHAEGYFQTQAIDVANQILKEHGLDCKTREPAIVYQAEYMRLLILREDPDDDLDTEDIDDAFLEDLLEVYSIMLQKECDYLQSDESIIETIKSNEWEFDEDGNLD